MISPRCLARMCQLHVIKAKGHGNNAVKMFFPSKHNSREIRRGWVPLNKYKMRFAIDSILSQNSDTNVTSSRSATPNMTDI